jgi:hypothetical protein
MKSFKGTGTTQKSVKIVATKYPCATFPGLTSEKQYGWTYSRETTFLLQHVKKFYSFQSTLF